MTAGRAQLSAPDHGLLSLACQQERAQRRRELCLASGVECGERTSLDAEIRRNELVDELTPARRELDEHAPPVTGVGTRATSPARSSAANRLVIAPDVRISSR